MMVGYLLVVFLIFLIHASHGALLTHPDLKLIRKLISENGYPLEVHKNIQTADDYLMDMHRIPRGLNNQNVTNRPVVLLMHGLMGSAENWIVNGPKKSLAYILADQGYDVWMGNNRGTIHSRKHVRFDPDFDTAYWQFSWHEIGIYDLPASIDYILAETKEKQIFYIGHSQGCTAFFVMLSLMPEYNSKIKMMVALAPAVFMGNMQHPAINTFALLGSSLDWVSTLLGVNELSPSNDILKLIGQTACRERVVMRELCSNMLVLLGGYDSVQFNRSLIPLLIEVSPGGASVKQVMHYAQEIMSGAFRQYDFGMLINLSKYGSFRPPDYDLSAITVPVALFYGNNDWLVSGKDVNRLYKLLPNPVLKYKVPFDGFDHLDFLLANDVNKLLNIKILNLLKQFQ